MTAKAKICVLDEKGVNTVEEISCMFNPKEYSVSRKVEWETPKNDKSNSGTKVFKGGTPASLTLDLFFDTYAHREQDNEVKDVRGLTQKIWDLTKMKENKKAGKNPQVQTRNPSMVLFTWGKAWFFKAYITNVDQQFTMFMPDGTPVRSVMKVTFEQADHATHFYGGSEGKQQAPATYKMSDAIRESDAAKKSARDLRHTPEGRGQTK